MYACRFACRFVALDIPCWNSFPLYCCNVSKAIPPLYAFAECMKTMLFILLFSETNNKQSTMCFVRRLLLAPCLVVTVRKIFLNKEFLSTQKMRLPQKWVHQDDSNDTPQPMWVEPCQNLYCGLRLAWIILIYGKGFGRAQPT